MRKLGTIIVTFILTMVFAIGGAAYFLLSEGIVTIQRRDEEHYKMVIEDGKVTETYTWNDLKGYTVSVDANDRVDINIK